ncbi:MAG: hypothetical protein AABZ47_09825 [Planctomycetota bacterium]
MRRILSAWFLSTLGVFGQTSFAQPDSPAKIDEILEKLERRGADVRDIRCHVRLVEDDQINLAKRFKQGQILFQITTPNPQFKIHFDKIESDGILGKQEWYLFDGQWLHQGLERIKQVTKQEMVPAGEKVDLFDLEKAPFPLPFGQKKETILRNFNVTLAVGSSGDPADTDHLICIPKPGSKMDRVYDKLEFFVHRELHLPTRIVVTKAEGFQIDTADFPDLTAKSINVGVSARDFEKPAAWKDYTEVVEPLAPNPRSP